MNIETITKKIDDLCGHVDLRSLVANDLIPYHKQLSSCDRNDHLIFVLERMISLPTRFTLGNLKRYVIDLQEVAYKISSFDQYRKLIVRLIVLFSDVKV